MERERVLKLLVKLSVLIAIFSFFAINILQNMDTLLSYEWHFNYAFLGISFTLMCLNVVFLSLGWGRILNGLGNDVRPRKILKIWFYSRIGVYIPGKVWAIIGRIYIAGKMGVKKSDVVMSTGIELMLLIASGFMVFSVSVVFWDGGMEFIPDFIAQLAIIPSLAIILYPPLFNRAATFVLKKMKVEREVGMGRRTVLSALSFFIMAWLFYGLANYFAVISVGDVGITEVPAFIGIFAVAWVVGLLTFIAPGGIGVREGIISLFLSAYFPLPVAITIALMVRLLSMAAEFFLIGISRKL